MFYDENFEEASILLDSVVVLKTLMGAENAKFLTNVCILCGI